MEKYIPQLLFVLAIVSFYFSNNVSRYDDVTGLLGFFLLVASASTALSRKSENLPPVDPLNKKTRRIGRVGWIIIIIWTLVEILLFGLCSIKENGICFISLLSFAPYIFMVFVLTVVSSLS